MPDDRVVITVEFRSFTVTLEQPLLEHLDSRAAADIVRREADLMAKTLERLYDTGADR